MLRLALGELVTRRVATIVTAAGLLTSILGFLLLTGTARTTQATIGGAIAGTWDGPYQILVRPAGVKSPLEERSGLLPPQFLSAIDGGITLPELDAIRAVDGVAVAAPISVVGVLQGQPSIPIDLAPYVSSDPLTVLRLKSTAVGDAGLSAFSAPTLDQYEVVAPQGTLVDMRKPDAHLDVGTSSIACSSGYGCFGGATPGQGTPRFNWIYSFPPAFPLLVVGVDPAAESALGGGLANCMVSGRALSASDRLETPSTPPDGLALGGSFSELPALFSSQPTFDESFKVEVEAAANPAAVLGGTDPQSLSGWSVVGTKTLSAQQMYEAALPSTAAQGVQSTYFSNLWVLGDMNTRVVGPDHIRAIARAPDVLAYTYSSNVANTDPGEALPPEAKDEWFRSVGTFSRGSGNSDVAIWNTIGSFDPDCVGADDTLGASGVLSPFHSSPALTSDGRPIGPTISPGSLLTSAPAIVTTLDSAQWFFDPQHFTGFGRDADAFISAVRVKVTDIGSIGPDSEARLTRIATDIHTATGLAVDIVAGSSPQQVAIDVPAGKFGRPAMTITEDWAAKGVALRFSRALTIQDASLAGLVLVGAVLLAAETAFVAVRRRRRDFGIFRALGWPAWRIGALVELELLLLGSGVGVLAFLVAAGVGMVLGNPAAWAGGIAAIPMAVGLALVAGLLPAISASRGASIEILEPRGAVRSSRSPRSVVTLAVGDLLRNRRLEALLGSAAIALGGVILGVVVLIEIAFAGQLDTTLLGSYIGLAVRPFHVALALLTVALGSLAAGELMTLSYLERQDELATLRALGWPRRAIVELISTEAVTVGILGGLLGSSVTVVAGVLLGARSAAIAEAAVTSSVVALIGILLAILAPVAHVYRARSAETLRGE